MMKKDGFSLWEQEGDLERMKLFFQKVSPSLEQKDRIKQLALEKIHEEEKKAQTETSQSGSLLPELPNLKTDTFHERIRRALKTVWWRWQWKLAVPVVVLFLIIFLGQAEMNGSLNFPLGIMGKATQSKSMQSGSAAYGTASPASPKSEASANSRAGFGFTAGAPAADQGAISKGAANPSIAIAPPLPRPEPQTPPADEGLAKKITYNMNASLQVEEVKLALDRITQEVKSLGGYVVESSQSQYQDDSSAQVTLKIPSSQLEGFRGLLSDVGKVLNQHTTANDITNQYYDSEARLWSLEAQETRYLEILKEAHTVEDILKIESYLGNIRLQIEQLKGQLKLWDHEVAYSTISLNLQTTPNLVNINDPWQPVSWAKTWQATQDAILKTLSSTWNGLNYLIVGIAYALPYLLLAGVIFGVYKGVKKYRRK